DDVGRDDRREGALRGARVGVHAPELDAVEGEAARVLERAAEVAVLPPARDVDERDAELSAVDADAARRAGDVAPRPDGRPQAREAVGRERGVERRLAAPEPRRLERSAADDLSVEAEHDLGGHAREPLESRPGVDADARSAGDALGGADLG